MNIDVKYLPEATVAVVAALAVISLAIAVLRRLRVLLIGAAALVVVGWALVIQPKYKEYIKLENVPVPSMVFPFRTPQSPTQQDAGRSRPSSNQAPTTSTTRDYLPLDFYSGPNEQEQ
jgi:hypothetical protein